MTFAFGVLRLAPRDAWALTPRELAAAWRAFAPATPGVPDAKARAALFAAFPDTPLADQEPHHGR